MDLKQIEEFGGIIGQTPAMHKVRATIMKAAAVGSNVLISGESGTGKELVARAIHAQSNRARCPFLATNCGAIPEPLVESELFGHARGSFTGAVAEHKGLFERAHGGTVFLDEIAEAPATMQVKLFRAIQEREFNPVGGNRTIKVDVRLIAASSENRLDSLRDELFYRLNVIRITLPSLRERRGDIAILAKHFLVRFSSQCDKPDLELTNSAIDVLRSHDWPGNVRQLEHVIESAVALAEGPIIEAGELDEIIVNSCRRTSTTTSAPEARGVVPVSSRPNGSTGCDEMSPYVRQAVADQLTLDALERLYVAETVKNNDGNVAAAARILGISRKTVNAKLQGSGEGPLEEAAAAGE